ncbi:MHYT domain-containing protein [Deinococcus sp. JMULE3]|uniref:MHYT domain-containing protein n=1 Tax=Deinococcus sp. JMULE3 TaxID=2518341 RepID=UPI001574F37E|nr:MHYT domain-containing protein [Deinococcus sp. JMULE3]
MEHEMLHHNWMGSYILLSYVIAVAASYMSLELAGRAGRVFTSAASRFWLIAQALVLGYGIWAMHFVGMMAFQVNAATSLNYPITVLSGLIAVAFVYPALLVLHSGAFNLRRLGIAGAIAGAGIVAMHYSGMAAYRMPGTELQINFFALIASVVIAVGASMAALFLFHQLTSDWAKRQTKTQLNLVKAGAAAVMGVAITGMHYTGMAALQYKVVDEMKVGIAADGIDTTLLALVIGVVSFLLLGLALTSVLMDAGRGGDLDDLDFGSAAD